VTQATFNLAREEPAATANPVAFYRAMLRIRIAEEAIVERYPEQEMRCPVHLSIGQEAVPVGICSTLRNTDQATTSHRCHAHYLAKGGDLRRMVAEIYGKAAGCCGGRGGSMHLFDTEAGMLLSLPIVASSIPIAVGAALALKRRGDGVAVAFLGDAATEEGAFHESMNLAASRQLPVLFVVENNLYSVYTPLAQRQPPRPLINLALAHDMPAEHGDGNDAVAVHAIAERAVARARAGEGPSLLVFDTYRWREHCGPNYDNDIGYRTNEEFLAWREQCPIDQLKRRLRRDRLLSAEQEARILHEIEQEIADAIAFAREAPFPEPDSAGARVYA
jgi:TPP-dependent pyruvate/acetoin dehydrogenase alpha subunit